MKEKPILMSAPMILALLSGAKTQTRRIFKDAPDGVETISHVDGVDKPGQWLVISSTQPKYYAKCPFGVVGDQLWVREAFRYVRNLDRSNSTQIAAQVLDLGWKRPWAPIQYEADGKRDNWDTCDPGDEPGRYRHARFMPRRASRLTLRIIDVRIERLMDISEEDAKAEGVKPVECWTPWVDSPDESTFYWAQNYFELWERINGKGSVNENPWVWAISFEVSP